MKVLLTVSATLALLLAGVGVASAQTLTVQGGLSAPSQGQEFIANTAGSCPVSFESSSIMYARLNGPFTGRWSWNFSMGAYKPGPGGNPALVPWMPEEDQNYQSGFADVVFLSNDDEDTRWASLQGRAAYTAAVGSNAYTGTGKGTVNASTDVMTTPQTNTHTVTFTIKPHH